MGDKTKVTQGSKHFIMFFLCVQRERFETGMRHSFWNHKVLVLVLGGSYKGIHFIITH